MFCRTSKAPDVLLEVCDASPLECLNSPSTFSNANHVGQPIQHFVTLSRIADMLIVQFAFGRFLAQVLGVFWNVCTLASEPQSLDVDLITLHFDQMASA